MFRAGIIHCASRMVAVWQSPDHFDIDKGLLRRLVNHVVSQKKFVENGQVLSNLKLDRDAFDQCIGEYERMGHMW